MKNNYFLSLTRLLLLFVFILTGTTSYSQEVKKDPLKELEKIKNDTPKVPSNYTATKVTLGQNASPEVKQDFLKKNGVNYYYVFSDSSGKIVTKEEMELVLKNEEESAAKNKLVNNPNK
jgi:hypothetical protein